MPVILIPSKPLNKKDNENMMMEERIQRQMEEEFKAEEEEIKEEESQRSIPKEEIEKLIDPPFIQFIVSYAEGITETESTFRLKTL
jgi:hypothetical protein